MTYRDEITAAGMENRPWQQRARAAGLLQRQLSKLLGRPEITISKQLRGHWGSGEPPKHLIAAIVAWELMTPEQRSEWIAWSDQFDAEAETKPDA